MLTRLINYTIHPGRGRRTKRYSGACANENWHGHNYELYVTIKGNPDPENRGF
ncbi:MAG: 6-carboxytetrahydropterin synthase [Puia sp.]